MTITEPTTADPTATPEWQQTACILCSINCGIEVRVDGPTIVRVRGDKAHPASEGYTCEKALRLDHYQNGSHRLTTPLRRRPDGTLRGDRLGHGHRRDRGALPGRDRRARRRQDPLLRRRRPGEPPRRRLRQRVPLGARDHVQLERAGPGEDGRVLGRRAAVRQVVVPHDRRLRARPGRRVLGQEPVAVARLPAGPQDPEGDRQRPRPHADRHRPAPHRVGRPRRHPPPARCRVATPTCWPPS